MHELKWAHTYDCNHAILNGRTFTNLMDSLPTDPAEVARYDVTVIVCMVNAPEGASKHSVFAPNSDQGAACLKPCTQLRAHKRPIMVLGGNAYLWNMPKGWDIMVQQMTLLCRSQGVMVIDGWATS